MKFKRKARSINGTTYLNLPVEICDDYSIGTEDTMSIEPSKDDDGNKILIIRKEGSQNDECAESTEQ